MKLFKLMSFFIGYVVILVTGETPEKFINMAAGRGIYLWDVFRVHEKGFLLKTRLKSLKPLRHIAKRTGCHYSIKAKKGFPFMVLRMRQRKMLVLGFLSFLCLLYFFSSLIWFIEVKGNQRLSTAEVLNAAAEAGLAQGKLKWQMNLESVEAEIMVRLPLVTWTGIYINGTKVTIEVAERIVPEEDDRRPAHLVASKAGLIKEVLVISGNPLAKEGEIVAPGHTLISGKIPAILEETPQSNDDNKVAEGARVIRPATWVHAKGIVRAKVWYEAVGEGCIIETGYRFTGQSAQRIILKYNQEEIFLTNKGDIPYEHYEESVTVKKLPAWRNITLPVELITIKYLELAIDTHERSQEEARMIAEAAAMEKIASQFPDDAEVQGKWSEVIAMSDDVNIVYVKAVVETVEDIGEIKFFEP